MFEDPKALTAVDWNNIHLLLQWLWIYLPLIATGSVTLVTAHALIPSLISTGHLSANANRLRTPLTIFAGVVFVAAVVILVFGINSTLDVGKFWDRYLI